MKCIGVDVGGTFTDLILVDEETGRIAVDKVASTPDDPSRGVVEGIRRPVPRRIGTVRVNRVLEDTIVTCEGESWHSKVTAQRLKAGDCVEIKVPNSGGYGDPLKRDPRKVLEDVLDGHTAVELAERDYGVVIDPAAMTVDQAATAERRGTPTVAASKA